MLLSRWIVAGEVISDLSERGIVLQAAPGRLLFRAPDGVVNARIRELLLEYKPEILELLQNRPELSSTGNVTVVCFVFNPFRVNSYVCHSDGEAVVVDPGCLGAPETDRLAAYLETHRLRVLHVLVTHGHVDHFCGADFLAQHSGEKLRIHSADLPVLADVRQANLMSSHYQQPVPGAPLEDGEAISFGRATLLTIHCPGHTHGSTCFHDPDNKLLFTGDILFRGAIGSRFATPDSVREMMASIQSRLMPLCDETVVLPGHGPRTSIGAERLRESSPDVISESAALDDI